VDYVLTEVFKAQLFGSTIICRDVIGGIDERALFEKQTTSLTKYCQAKIT
jgi:hypothetical protein